MSIRTRSSRAGNWVLWIPGMLAFVWGLGCLIDTINAALRAGEMTKFDNLVMFLGVALLTAGITAAFVIPGVRRRLSELEERIDKLQTKLDGEGNSHGPDA